MHSVIFLILVILPEVFSQVSSCGGCNFFVAANGTLWRTGAECVCGSYFNLDFSNKNITTLSSGVFQGLKSVSSLDLSNNQITMLPAGLFQDLTLDSRSSWVSFRFAKNKISKLFPSTFQGIIAPKSMLPEPGAFICLSIEMNDNLIREIPVGVFQGLPPLKVLYLHNNQISNLHEGLFQGLQWLESLSLYNNSITTLNPGVFQDLTALYSLFLSRNQIASVPLGVFQGSLSSQGPMGLRMLGLSNNKISVLPAGVFQGLRHLEALDLSSNQLTTLPKNMIQSTAQYKSSYPPTLLLSNNSISVLPAGVFRGFRGLQYLDLSNNQISSLSEDAFEDLDALEFIGLGGNSKVQCLPHSATGYLVYGQLFLYDPQDEPFFSNFLYQNYPPKSRDFIHLPTCVAQANITTAAAMPTPTPHPALSSASTTLNQSYLAAVLGTISVLANFLLQATILTNGT